MTDKRPDLSVIVPVYNVESYLPQCFDALFAMSDVAEGMTLEVIAVNDGSSDGSGKVIEEYANKFPQQMVVIEQKNSGVSKARNVGIEAAKGKWLAFVDSDDVVDVKAMLSLLKKAEVMGLDVVAGRAQIFGNGAERMMAVPQMLFDLPPLSGKAYLELYYENASVEKRDFRPEACFMLYQRTLLLEEKIRFEEGIAHEDELFTPSVLLVAKAVKMCDELFYFYRQHGESITHRPSEKHKRSKALVAVKLAQQLRDHGVSQKFVNNRIVGWCREGKAYLCLRQMLVVARLKKFGWKDAILLCLLLLMSVPRSCAALSDERRDAER